MQRERMKVLVYGANGVQGGAVARRLLGAGHSVRGISRRGAVGGGPSGGPSGGPGVETAQADMGDLESLKRASEGVDAVFLVTPALHYAEEGFEYGRNAVDAAEAAGVGHLVFNASSRIHAVPGFDSKRRVEEHLRASGLSHVILRLSFYMENFLGPWAAPGIVNRRTVAFLTPRALRASWISVDDMAALSVAALERPHLSGETFHVGGPEALDGNGVAGRFGVVLDPEGRPMDYFEVPIDPFEEQVAAFAGAEVARGVADSYRWAREHPDTDLFVADMEGVLEHLPVELTPLEAWIRKQDWSVHAEAV